MPVHPTRTLSSTAQQHLDDHNTILKVSHDAGHTETFFHPSTAVVGKVKGSAPVLYACEVVDVRLAADTAPTGAALIADVWKNGTSIYTSGTKPQLAISSRVSVASVPPATSLAAGDRLEVEIEQIGSTVAGSEITFSIRTRAT